MKTALILMALFLSGCASWETLQAGVAIQGARAADEALQVHEWGICEAATVGSWKRRYGQDPDKADAWAKLCSKNAQPIK